MSMVTGKFSSMFKPLQTKIIRTIKTLGEILRDFEDMEVTDILNQESFSRQNEVLNRKFSQAIRNLEEQTTLNYQLTKENISLREHIKLLTENTAKDRIEIDNLRKKVTVLNHHKKTKVEKHEKWLKKQKAKEAKKKSRQTAKRKAKEKRDEK